MSGREFQSKVPVAKCGCGGRAIVWDRPSDYGGDRPGTVSAWCSRHCGIEVSRVYRTSADCEKVARKVVSIWNKALTGKAR